MYPDTSQYTPRELVKLALDLRDRKATYQSLRTHYTYDELYFFRQGVLKQITQLRTAEVS